MKKFRIAFIGFIVLIFMSSPLWAANIGLYGSNSNTDISSLLSANGHTVTDFGGTAPTAIQLSGLDVLIMLRTTGTNDIANFVTNGGLLITEWDASGWALDTANLIDADDTGGGFVGTGTQVTFTAAGASLAQGVNNPYSDSARTEFFRNFANIGGTVDILATRPGSIPAILGGESGNGQVLVIGYDWADGFAGANADTEQLILNAVNFQRSVVPTMNEWGMIIFMALAGVGSIYYLRKYRRV